MLLPELQKCFGNYLPPSQCLSVGTNIANPQCKDLSGHPILSHLTQYSLPRALYPHTEIGHIHSSSNGNKVSVLALSNKVTNLYINSETPGLQISALAKGILGEEGMGWKVELMLAHRAQNIQVLYATLPESLSRE